MGGRREDCVSGGNCDATRWRSDRRSAWWEIWYERRDLLAAETNHSAHDEVDFYGTYGDTINAAERS